MSVTSTNNFVKLRQITKTPQYAVFMGGCRCLTGEEVPLCLTVPTYPVSEDTTDCLIPSVFAPLSCNVYTWGK